MEPNEYEKNDEQFAQAQEAPDRHIEPVTQNVQPLCNTEFDGNTLDKAQQRVNIESKLKLIAVQLTNERDWVDLGGNPYLTEAGCMKFAGVYGVSFRDVNITAQPMAKDDLGLVREFTATVTAIFQNRQDTEFGMASSADKFFQRGGKRPPLSEVCAANVMKKAVTNAKARAVKKILGLSFTWDEVKAALKAGGRDASRVASVSYGGKSGKQTKSTGKGVMNVQKQEIGDMIIDLCEGDKEAARELLWELTKFKKKDGTEHGVRSVKDLSDKWAAKVHPKVKKKFDAEVLQKGGDDQ